MLRLSFVAISALSFATVVAAAPVTQRLRGTVESTSDGMVTIKTNDGKSVVVGLAADTKFASVLKSNLDAVKDGVFIGTATKGENPPTALEVVVFPEAMRGTGEGHYDWDAITDTTAGGKLAQSAMTNGTIKTATKPMTKSAMTNGTIKSGSAAGGAKTLTVTYSGGKSMEIVVPSTAPVVTVEPADLSVLKPGAKVFAVAAENGAKLDGKRFLVGKDGVTPPM